MGLQRLFGRGHKKSQVRATTKSIVEDSVEVTEKSVEVTETSVSELFTRLAENPERCKMLADEISSGHRSFTRVRLRSTVQDSSVFRSCGFLWARLYEETEGTPLDWEESLSIPLSRGWGPARMTPAGRVMWQEGFVGSVRYKADATGVIRGRITVSLSGYLLEIQDEYSSDMDEYSSDMADGRTALGPEIEIEGLTMCFVALPFEEVLELSERVQQLAEELLPEYIADAIDDYINGDVLEGWFVWLNSEYLWRAYIDSRYYSDSFTVFEAYVTWVRKVLAAPPEIITQSTIAPPRFSRRECDELTVFYYHFGETLGAVCEAEGSRIGATEAVVGTRVRHEIIGDGTIVGIPAADIVAISFDGGVGQGDFVLSKTPMRLLE